MKKIYLILLTAVFCLGLSAQDKSILVIYAGDETVPHLTTIVDAVNAVDGMAAVIAPFETYADVIADADAVIMTELPGSGDASKYGDFATKPTICLKTYAIRADKGETWAWVANEPAQFLADKSTMDNAGDIEGTTKIKIMEDHAIFEGIGAKDDEFSFASAVLEGQAGEAHYQTVDLSLSAKTDIASASTMIGESSWEAGLAAPGITGLLWAVDDNSTSKKSVVFGIHSQYVLSDDGMAVIVNSAKWCSGWEPAGGDAIENINASGIEIYPNPMQSVLNINHAGSVANISIVDITGKVVANAQNNGSSFVSIDTDNLVEGLYIVKLQTTNGNVYTEKLVK